MRKWCIAHGFVIMLVLVFGPAATLGDPIFPLGQDRGIEAEATMSSGEQTDSDYASDFATGFELFNSSVAATAGLGDPNDPVTASSTVAQMSQILAASILGTGTVGTGADPNTPGYFPYAWGNSYFDVSFEITTELTYSLVGQLDVLITGSGVGFAGIMFSGPGGSIFELEIEDGSEPFDVSGLLAPGEYSLAAYSEASVDADGATASGQFDFNLTLIPEPTSLALIVCLGLLGARRHAGRT